MEQTTVSDATAKVETSTTMRTTRKENNKVDGSSIASAETEPLMSTATSTPSRTSDSAVSKPPEEDERSFVFETRLERADELRALGSEAFRQGNVDAALKLYERGLFHAEFDELSYNFELQDEHRAAVDAVRVPLLVNCATVLVRLDRLAEALDKVESALKLDAKHVKAVFRRAQIRRKMGDLERAHTDFTTALTLDPSNDEARRALDTVTSEIETVRRRSDRAWKSALGGKFDPPASAVTDSHYRIEGGLRGCCTRLMGRILGFLRSLVARRR